MSNNQSTIQELFTEIAEAVAIAPASAMGPVYKLRDLPPDDLWDEMRRTHDHPVDGCGMIASMVEATLSKEMFELSGDRPGIAIMLLVNYVLTLKDKISPDRLLLAPAVVKKLAGAYKKHCKVGGIRFDFEPEGRLHPKFGMGPFSPATCKRVLGERVSEYRSDELGEYLWTELPEVAEDIPPGTTLLMPAAVVYSGGMRDVANVMEATPQFSVRSARPGDLAFLDEMADILTRAGLRVDNVDISCRAIANSYR